MWQKIFENASVIVPIIAVVGTFVVIGYFTLVYLATIISDAVCGAFEDDDDDQILP